MAHAETLERGDAAVLLEEDMAGVRDNHYLIVYNDDQNTFEWVIKSLIDVCKHSFLQAEQLSLIIHFKGKATIKSGPRSVLSPLKDCLLDRGISASLEG